MVLNSEKLDTYGNKILCVDDIIASNNSEKEGRTPFLQVFRFKSEDVIFTSACEDALEIMEKNSDIGLVFVDIRIPRRSGDLSDFNPEDPTQGWGSILLEQLIKNYLEKGLKIIIFTGYSTEDLSDPSILDRVDGFYKKPLHDKAEDIINKIQEFIERDWKYDFNYQNLDIETINFVEEKTQQIKNSTKRVALEVLQIGRNLIEIKEKLGYGLFEEWKKKKFIYKARMAERFMQAYRTFGDRSAELADFGWTQEVLFRLSEKTTTDEGREEAIARAKEGESITMRKVKEIKEKHQKKAEDTPIETSPIKQTEINFSSGNVKEKSQAFTPKLLDRELAEQTKRPASILPPEIIGIQQNVVANSYWQLGEKHYLYCGEPKNELFLAQLPFPTIILSFPPNGNWQKIPLLETKLGMIYNHNYNSFSWQKLKKKVEEEIRGLTEGEDIVVFFFLYHPNLFFLAHSLDCQCYIAEPNLELCDRLIKRWKKMEEVKRIKLTP